MEDEEDGSGPSEDGDEDRAHGGNGPTRPSRSVKRFGPKVTPIIIEAISFARMRAATQVPYPASVEKQEEVIIEAWNYALDVFNDDSLRGFDILDSHVKQV